MDIRIAFVAALVPTAQLIAQPTPLFHWTFDQTAGNIAHDAYGGMHGTLLNGANWAPGQGHHNGACRFDGVDDRIIAGPCDITSGGPGFSISLWVKVDLVTGAERTLVAKTVGPNESDHIWSIAFVSGSALRFRLRTGSATNTLTTAPSSLFAGSWYHVAATYDGATMRILLNGSLMASMAANGLLGFHPHGPASFAARSTGTAPFSGWLDDIRVYDIGLTVDDITDILFEDEVTVGMSDAPRMSGPGQLRLPDGSWRSLTIMDTAGRIVATNRITGGNTEDVGTLPTGLYLVCLQDGAQRRGWPMFFP